MKKRISILALVILAAFALAACGAPDLDFPAPAPAAEAPAVAEAPPAPAPPVDMAEEFAPPPADLAQMVPGDNLDFEDDGFLLPILTPEDAGDRRLEYSVYMQLQTEEFDSGILFMQRTISEMDGYLIHMFMQGHDLHNPTTERSVDFRFRIPTERLPEFVATVYGNFNVMHLWQAMEEVTDIYQGTAWNLEDLRTEESRLLELLEEADEEDRAEIQSQLDSIRWSIRALEQAQENIMSRVLYSTIEAQLLEAIILEEVPGPRFSTFELILLIFAALALLTVVALIVAFAVRKRGGKNQEEA